MTKPKTKDGRCAHCGSKSMHLARDFTAYSPCAMVADKWCTTYVDAQTSQAEDALRFFCADCGTQHAVPVELAA